jgi:alpha-tubulin suppressor-like RCC1 family protein
MSWGAGHIVVLTNNSRVYSWGCNRLGQLGLNLKQENLSFPNEITDIRCKNIENVYCGAGHSFALDSYGSVYSWGASADYQTGHSQNEVDIYQPKRIDFETLGGFKIKDIACGIKHTLMLTSESEVISFGCTEYGQWGRGLSSPIGGKKVHNKKPAVISTLEGKIITNIYWGGAHSIWLTSNQDIFCFGLNSSGQLGLGDEVNHISFPEKIRQFTSFSIKSIAWGDEMSIFLTSNNDLFACGWNGSNQFASIKSSNLFYPTKLNSSSMFGGKGSNISQVYCSDKTVMFLLGKDKLYQCGSIIGEYNKSTSSEEMSIHFIKELDKDIVDVVWARSQIFVIANDKPQKKEIFQNEGIVDVMNGNYKGFYTQKPEDNKISFYQDNLKKKDLMKIIQEK